MTTTTDSTVAGRVAAGAAYLDEHEPDWWQRIDLDKLNLASPCRCILGQLDGNFWDALNIRRDIDVVADGDAHLGFNVPSHIDDDYATEEFDALTAAWRDLITTRRAGAGDAGRISTGLAVLLILIALICVVALTGNWGQ